MLRRGASAKSSYSPYSTGHRVKKAESRSRLDILPNRPNIWQKQEQIKKDVPDGSPSNARTCASGHDAPVSCPGTPTAQHGKTGCPSPAATLKRPSTLSRHASAAGFPLQSWVFSKGYAKGTVAQSPTTESPETVSIDVEDIPLLLRDVARFADAVEKLKDVVLGEGKVENRRPLAHECLGEVLRVFRQVISMYPLLNTVETLTAAGKLISRVKGFHYESPSEVEKKDFEKAIETIAVAFSSNVSELLMGELDSSSLLSVLPTEKSRSMENLYGASPHSLEGSQMRSDLCDSGISAEEVDIILQRSEGGVDSALTYAKAISKYMKDLISYVEKRMALELEFSKGLHRLYQSSKQSIAQPHMPFFCIYSQALEQDLEQSTGIQQSTGTLHNQTFIQPLMQRKLEHEKKCKEIKEQWNRAKRKLMECETNLHRAKQTYITRCAEYDKAKTAASKEEGSKSLDKKKRLEEEARNKAEEAEATYRTCIADATTHHQELEDMKVTVLRHIQEIIRQSDQTLRSATISYYQNMHMQTVALPVHYQTLCENSKLYEPGQQYATHVKELQMPAEPETSYEFELYSDSISQPPTRPRNDSSSTAAQSGTEVGVAESGEMTSSQRDGKKAHGHRTHKSWGSTVSDTDSVGGGSGPESLPTSTGDISKISRTSSTGTMSSTDDPEETTFETANVNGVEPEIVVPTGPFRNVGLSKAAQTHKLRKLRSPAKCRECDSYVYFQGAECEECFLACHKRCLETMTIQCGHKKLQGRLQLFGRDFSQVVGKGSDVIPFIIKKCICEIERRALRMKGIYRVNGVKTRVEKLCQAFENGKELVELSQSSPHDISNVLKLYLRQLPEPIMPFRLYNSLMGLAKESLHSEGSEGGEAGKGAELVDSGADTDAEVLAQVQRLKEHLVDLPKANITTLRYIVRHLHRVADFEQDNKMSPSNLGIVFGPSLMRPRPSGATVSLSSLVDYPYQARIVEMLVVFYMTIFPSDSSQFCASQPVLSSLQQDCMVYREEENRTEGDSEHSDEPGKCDLYKVQECQESDDQDLDSDLELEEAPEENPFQHDRLTKQESECSTDEELLSSGAEFDPHCQSSRQTELDTVLDGEPPALPDSEPPHLDDPNHATTQTV
ncbi:rho GTPase-activating protein 45 isoform X2 [Denticeps clupeoides]|uniref:rho GTPase-activating protein 45 isoform X2 n=1 Tax=Denticeps clupeoides TaxID=299321 RepID=UPI0010A5109E|nr:rho GTPase-activating protein 45-like isoform X2 [Denticeps clupeoides]